MRLREHLETMIADNPEIDKISPFHKGYRSALKDVLEFIDNGKI